MKQIIASIYFALLAAMAFAADNGSVQVNPTNHVLTYPLDFFTVNGVTTNGDSSALTVRVGALETNLVATSNALSGRIDVHTGQIAALSNSVSILQTNTASLEQGIAATNAQARVAVLEASAGSTVPYDGTNIVITGNMTAAAFYGDGANLTGVQAAVTAGVNQIVVGIVTNSGDVTLTGNGITAIPGTINFARTEYITKNIVPTTDTYELTWEQPRDEAITLQRVWAKCDANTCTFDIVTGASNGLWRTYTTNTAPVVATIYGASTTNFILTTIPAGTMWGIRILEADMTKVHNVIVGVKVQY